MECQFSISLVKNPNIEFNSSQAFFVERILDVFYQKSETNSNNKISNAQKHSIQTRHDQVVLNVFSKLISCDRTA
jgi:hypothetical protein